MSMGASSREAQIIEQDQLEEQIQAYPPLTGADLRFLPARLGGTAPTPEEARAKEEHDRTRTVDLFNAKKAAKREQKAMSRRRLRKLRRRV